MAMYRPVSKVAISLESKYAFEPVTYKSIFFLVNPTYLDVFIFFSEINADISFNIRSMKGLNPRPLGYKYSALICKLRLQPSKNDHIFVC